MGLPAGSGQLVFPPGTANAEKVESSRALCRWTDSVRVSFRPHGGAQAPRLTLDGIGFIFLAIPVAKQGSHIPARFDVIFSALASCFTAA